MHIIWQRVSISKHEVVCKTWHFCSRLMLDHQWSLMLLPQLAIQWYYWCVHAATSDCQHYLFLDLLNLYFRFRHCVKYRIFCILWLFLAAACLLYADNIILVWPSISGFQAMSVHLRPAWQISWPYSLILKNVDCIVIGKMHNIDKTPVILCGSIVIWCNSIKYLGIYLLASKVLKFDVIACRRSFYIGCL